MSELCESWMFYPSFQTFQLLKPAHPIAIRWLPVGSAAGHRPQMADATSAAAVALPVHVPPNLAIQSHDALA